MTSIGQDKEGLQAESFVYIFHVVELLSPRLEEFPVRISFSMKSLPMPCGFVLLRLCWSPWDPVGTWSMISTVILNFYTYLFVLSSALDVSIY